MDLTPMGKFAMDSWAAVANLETEPDSSQRGPDLADAGLRWLGIGAEMALHVAGIRPTAARHPQAGR